MCVVRVRRGEERREDNGKEEETGCCRGEVCVGGCVMVRVGGWVVVVWAGGVERARKKKWERVGMKKKG